MKNAYKVFADYFESQKPSGGIHSLPKYLDWFNKQFGEITTPINSSDASFSFIFDTASESTVCDDLLKVLSDRLDLEFDNTWFCASFTDVQLSMI